MQTYTASFNNKRLIVLVALVLVLFCNSTFASDTPDSPRLSLSVIGGVGLTQSDIQVNDLTFPYVTGFIGVGSKYQLNDASNLFVNYGQLSTSKKCATCDEDASDSLDIETIEFGYNYRYSDFTSPISIDLEVSKELTTHFGEALGVFDLSEVTASIDSTSSFVRGSVSLNYHLNDDTVLTAGGGINNWDMSVLAKSALDTGIRLSTNIETGGTDRFYFIETSFVVLGRAINLGIRQSNLNADNETVFREVYAGVSLPW
jgi:hypothetical protein